MGTLAEATELKNKGNDAFKKQDWPAAVEWYTKAIETYDKEPSFYTNRAQVGLRCHAPHTRDHFSDDDGRRTSNSNHTGSP